MHRRVLEEVWSPTQHLTLWLGAWLSGHVGYDHLTEAFEALGAPGPHPGTLELIDAKVPEVVDLEAPLGRAELLRLLRAVTEPAEAAAPERPLLRLVLSGAGDPPTLPANSPAAAATRAAGSAIVVADTEWMYHHVLVPAQPAWQWYTIEGPLPEPAHLSPGEADFQLAEAARNAAARIAALSAGAPGIREGAAVEPRLAVGLLNDHLDMAWLPEVTPRRALGVLARADRLAALLEVAQGDRAGHGGSDYDPELIPLWRAIRQARISAVDYAIRSFMDF